MSSFPVLKRVVEPVSVTSTNSNEDSRQIWQHQSYESLNANTQNNENPYARQISEKNKRLLADIMRVAQRPYNILITGETGTGKTFAARQIHQNSTRASRSFTELNCANLSENLVEAELFGYRKGAFTGADRDHKGLFEEADGGMLFLDEIGDVPPPVQNKLLKAIEEKKIKRLGTNRYIECDVQIISATSRNLVEMIHHGEFREDLYCRLAVLKVEVPPLRERREDIPGLINYYLREAAETITGSANQKAAFKIERGAIELLSKYDFPGNIRVLKNLIYELTSYISLDEAITVELVQTALKKLSALEGLTTSRAQVFHRLEQKLLQQEENNSENRIINNHFSISSYGRDTSLQEIAGEGDIILPIEVCIIRRGETLKEWTSRAKKHSIEAARKSSGGTLESISKRLGITVHSLSSHLRRTEATRRKWCRKQK